jgi:hypothetical protein
MGSFGFFGKYQVKNNFTSDGRAVTTSRYYDLAFSQKQQIKDANCYFVFEYDSSNPSPAPDQYNLTNSGLIAYNGSDFRGVSTYSVTAPNIGNIFASFLASNSTRRFVYNTSTARTRLFNLYLNRPELIDVFTFQEISGYITTVVVPYLVNCRYMNLGSLGLSGVLTTINGAWPTSLQYLDIEQSGSTLSTIQRPFPKSLLGLVLVSQNTTLGGITNINTLLADCSNLVHLAFRPPLLSQVNVSSVTPLQAGTLNISHMTALLTLVISGSGSSSIPLTDINYGFTSLKHLFLSGCTNLSATTFRAIANIAMATSNMDFFNIGSCNQTWSRNIGSSDVPNTCTNFYVHTNIITGTISLSASRPNLKEFGTGIDTNSITSSASKNNFSTVDVSGLTAATLIDLSNSQIQTLTLPANTVCTELGLGGNKLDVTVLTSLVSQIIAMTALVNLYLSAGAASNVNVENGQNSTNGFGANLDLSALTHLSILQANACVLSGNIKLPTSLTQLYIDTNNLSGIQGTGTFGLLTIFRAANNSSFTFDFTRLTVFTSITVNNTGVTSIDLSARTATTTLSPTFLNCSNCPSLLSILFPATQAKTVVNASTTNTINISSCASLSSLTNQENINYSSLTVNAQRNFTANGCALDIDFKIGVNNFLPSAIQIQNNGMSNANVNTNIGNIYTNRSKWSTTVVAKSLNIAGTNAAPSGTYQAPTGFVLGSADGTPITAKEQAYVLVNNYGWTITMN